MTQAESITENKNNDVELLDFLKEHFGYKTDVQLADYLNLSKQAIYKIRADEVGLGVQPRLTILNKLSCLEPVTNLLSNLTARHLAIAIAGRIDDRAAIIALANIEDNESLESSMILLTLVKKLTKSTVDKDLAGKVGLKRPSLSMIRNGKARFGAYPLLEILKLMEPNVNFNEFEGALKDSRELLRLLQK